MVQSDNQTKLPHRFCYIRSAVFVRAKGSVPLFHWERKAFMVPMRWTTPLQLPLWTEW